MKLNVGSPDRIIRILFALAVGLLYSFDLISGTVALILGAIALVLFITAAVGFCPIYAALKLSTKGSAAK